MSSCSEQRFVIDAPIVAELEARKHGLPTRGRNKQYLAIRGGSLKPKEQPAVAVVATGVQLARTPLPQGLARAAAACSTIGAPITSAACLT